MRWKANKKIRSGDMRDSWRFLWIPVKQNGYWYWLEWGLCTEIYDYAPMGWTRFSDYKKITPKKPKDEI